MNTDLAARIEELRARVAEQMKRRETVEQLRRARRRPS